MNTISIQDLIDLVELASLACRTERDRRFVREMAQKFKVVQQAAQQVAQTGKKPEVEEQEDAVP